MSGLVALVNVLKQKLVARLNAWRANPLVRRVGAAVGYVLAIMAAKSAIAPLLSVWDLGPLVYGHLKTLQGIGEVVLALAVWLLWGRTTLPSWQQIVLRLANPRWREVLAVVVVAVTTLIYFARPVQIARTSEPLAFCKTSEAVGLSFDRWDVAQVNMNLEGYAVGGQTCQLNPPLGCDPPACSFTDLPGRAVDHVLVSVYGGFIWPTGFKIAIDAGGDDVLGDVAYSNFLRQEADSSSRRRMEFALVDSGRSRSAAIYYTSATVARKVRGGIRSDPEANDPAAQWFDSRGCRQRVQLDAANDDCS